MRFLHLLPWTSSGGVHNYTMNLIKALHTLGHQNVCIGPKTNASRYNGLYEWYITIPDIRPIPSILKAYVLVALNTTIFDSKVPIDSVILNNDPRLLKLLRKLADRETPILKVQHGTYLNYLYWSQYISRPLFDSIRELIGVKIYHYDVLRYIKKLTKRQINFKIVAVSKKTMEELIHYGIPPSKIHVITGGVDKALFKPVEKEFARKILTEKLRITLRKDEELLAHVGVSLLKGSHFLVKALRRIRGKLKNCKVILIGDPRSSYRKLLLDMISRYGLDDEIIIIKHVDSSLMPILYNAADVVVQPSYSEGCPLTVLESLACGTPVVTTAVGCNEDHFKTLGLCDIIVKIQRPDFSEEIADRIIYALENRDILRRRIIAAIDKIPSWSDIAKEYIDLISYLKTTI